MFFQNMKDFIVSLWATVYENVTFKVAYTKNQVVRIGGKVMRGIRKIWGFAVAPFKTLYKDFAILTKGFGRLFRIFFLVLVIGILVYVKTEETVVITITGMIETFFTAVYFKQKDKADKNKDDQ